MPGRQVFHLGSKVEGTFEIMFEIFIFVQNTFSIVYLIKVIRTKAIIEIDISNFKVLFFKTFCTVLICSLLNVFDFSQENAKNWIMHGVQEIFEESQPVRCRMM